MPDETRSREAFGLPGSPRGNSVFPQARLTAMVEVGARAAFAWHAVPLAESEEEQAERLFGYLWSGMLAFADRCYCGFPLWPRAAAAGADLLWRNMNFPVVEALGDGSWRTVFRGRGRRRNCGEFPVRVIACRIKDSNEAVMLAAALLDCGHAPAAELAALCHERWEIGTAYDEIKTRIFGSGAALRSKTPALMFQEINALMPARYAAHSLIYEAADRTGQYPDRLSFAHAVRAMRRRIISPSDFPPTDQADRLIDEPLEERTVAGRDQVKPRGVRRKMSGFPLRNRAPLSRRKHGWKLEIIPICP